MSHCTFDQLLFALRTAVEAANDALRIRRTQQLNAANAGGDALHVEIPTTALDDAPLESVVIPMRWFRDWRVPQVTEFSVDFACRLHYRKVRSAPPELVIDMSRPRRTWWYRPRTHHLRIAFRATDQWQPNVTLDGRVAHFPLTGVR